MIGRVSGDPVASLRKAQPMADYLAGRLSHLGISTGEVIVASDNRQMVGLLQAGRVDVISESVLSALHFAEVAGAEPLLREWKKGVASYNTVIITKNGSGITDLDSLRGKVIAFEDAGSTSGFLAPAAILQRHGLELVELSSPRDVPPPDKVGYVFTNGEINVAAWVARGLAHAGAFSNLDWDDVERSPDVFKESLHVVYEGKPMLRSVLLVRGDMDPAIKSAIHDIMTAMDDDPDAAPILKTYYKVTQYDALIGDAAQDLSTARAMYTALSGQIR